MPSTPARGRGQACYPTSWNRTIRHGTEVLRSLTPHGQSHLAGCPRWLSTIRSNSYLFWSSYSWIIDVMAFIQNEWTSRAFTLAAVMWSSLSWAFKSEFISSSRRACIRQTNGLWLEATDTWSFKKRYDHYTWEMPDSNSSGFSPFGLTIFALVLNMACVWNTNRLIRIKKTTP